MELKCLHCGKEVNVSLEEIAMNGKVIVCPQCLGEIVAHDVDISGVSLPSKKSNLSTASSSGCCKKCGRPLPSTGLNFCPFCGVSLTLKKTTRGQEMRQESRQPQENAAGEREESTSQEASIKELPYVQAYRYMPQLSSKKMEDKPASLRFHVFAILVIVVLIAIFVFIVWAGNR